MTSVTVELNDTMFKALEKRAKNEMMSVGELAEDIIRRSMLSYKGASGEDVKLDDALVSVFSRKKTGKENKTAVKEEKKEPFYEGEFK